MPKAIKKKVTKPSKGEDVTNIIHEVKETLALRQKILFPVFLVTMVSLIVIAGFFIYRSNLQTRADSLEYEAYKIYYGIHQRQPLQREAQYQQALDKFRQAYAAKKSPLSLFYIASSYADLGKFDEALKALKELNERFPDDEKFVPLSYYKMATINLRKGDKETALKLLDTLANYKTGAFKDLALSESAKILDSMGKKEEAAKKYEELKKDFPNSPFIKAGQAPSGEKKD